MPLAIDDSQPGGLVELASGIDALYCSGRADLTPEFLRLVDRAKDEAQVTGREAEVALGDSVFRVQSFGMGRYPYRLDHEHGVIAVTDSEKLPAVKIQPRATFLHGVYEDGGSFTGFVFGKRKTKTIAARIYDKTAEVQAKGNAYWEDIWGPNRN